MLMRLALVTTFESRLHRSSSGVPVSPTLHFRVLEAELTASPELLLIAHSIQKSTRNGDDDVQSITGSSSLRD